MRDEMDMTRDVGRDVDFWGLVYGFLVSSYAMHIISNHVHALHCPFIRTKLYICRMTEKQ